MALGLIACGPPGKVGDDGGAPISACDLSMDADSMTRAYTIQTLAIPETNRIGFNIDGRSTTTAGDVAGCKRPDGQPGGIDNALAEIIEGLGTVLESTGVDINGELQDAVDDGAIALMLELDHWNGTATDTCVGVRIAGASAGAPITALTGSGALEDSVISVAFAQSLTISPTFQLSPDGGLGGCTEGCTPVNLPITIGGARAHLVFAGGTGMDALVVGDDATNANSTYVAGYVLYAGTTEEGAFQPGLSALVTTISPDLVTTVDTIFAGFLDLDSSPTLMACTQAGGQLSADAFSAAILVAGAQQAAH